jgi:hypothetical protein
MKLQGDIWNLVQPKSVLVKIMQILAIKLYNYSFRILATLIV